ncbi:LacI family DNA-binding transcriptional regulator [Stackebrandtia nassauensis]|uniref:Transcriptional regulator, LacI family n=1 Tax=Stackebrandtia nassauensis (strain DSM 44728 / CIP 108903 / NRRL B-16338 / NBRC 102104 / LLR-40K-21) TaxID=446470 RepID=D3QBP0_STANL|nr:LacI family DNA-binding transcriptional regulator [Stackebrandtia nassauensis]ADD42922.1 transcriptional regulator, LacI family [Stackebrandtia nassauensis DSM 44728]
MTGPALPRATLAEVAARAGVSKATASKVLNGRPGVSEETRRQVHQVIRELNYTPSTGPREATDHGTVHVVFDTIVNMYSPHVLDGVINAGRELGVDVVTSVLAPDGVIPDRSLGVDRIKEIAVRGHTGLIVVTTQLTGEEIATCENLGLPLVVIDPVNPLDERVISIGATNWAGGVQATRHLLGLGHTRIAFAGGAEHSVPGRERLHGYREALETAGIVPDPTLIRRGPFTSETGAEIGGYLLGLDEVPTAIFAASDAIAVGVIQVARSRGLRIPEDLSVVGFDDTYGAMWTDPPLTTVRQPLRQMGRVAARTLLDIADDKVPDSHHVQLATTLVVRDSTATPSASSRRSP